LNYTCNETDFLILVRKNCFYCGTEPKQISKEYKTSGNSQEWIDKWKVLLVKAHGTSGRDDVTILGEPVIAGPGTACTETYLVISLCANEREAKNLAAYMRTRFVRFLVSLRKITQNITRDSYSFVPKIKMNREWSDQELYERYKITKDQVKFIESLIADKPGVEDNSTAEDNDE
jgi:site-specific DNA-methyltransferase (adenine-specific)